MTHWSPLDPALDRMQESRVARCSCFNRSWTQRCWPSRSTASARADGEVRQVALVIGAHRFFAAIVGATHHPVTVHGIRHTFHDLAGQQGVPDAVVKAMTGRSGTDVNARGQDKHLHYSRG